MHSCGLHPSRRRAADCLWIQHWVRHLPTEQRQALPIARMCRPALWSARRLFRRRESGWHIAPGGVLRGARGEHATDDLHGAIGGHIDDVCECAQQLFYLCRSLARCLLLVFSACRSQATVQVEFRAPSSVVAERLATQHQELVTGLTTVYSAPGCTGRRSLQEVGGATGLPTAESTEVANLRKQLKESNEKLEQSNKQLVQSNEQLKQSSETVVELTRAVHDCEASRRSENKTDEELVKAPYQPNRRQVQVLTASPEFTRVALPSGEIRACAARPCELAETCLNGGDCVPGSLADFTCHCLAGFAGPRCGDAVAASGGDPCGAGAIVNVPADGGGSTQIAFEPVGGYPDSADCVWHIECPAAVPVRLQFVSFDTEVSFARAAHSLLHPSVTECPDRNHGSAAI